MRIRTFFIFSLCIAAQICFGQNGNSALFEKRRSDFVKSLKDFDFAIIPAASQKNKTNDIFFQFHQDRNLLYLSDFNYPGAMLILSEKKVAFKGQTGHGFMFIEKPSQYALLWNGYLPELDDTKKMMPDVAVFYMDDFKEFLEATIAKNNKILLSSSLENLPAANFASTWTLDRALNFLNSKLLEQENLVATKQFKQIMNDLRGIKSDYEIAQIREAVEITCAAHKEVFCLVEPGLSEKSIDAAVDFVFKWYGAEGEAFSSIIGSGANSTILHYTANNKTIAENDLLLCDIGASFNGYAADITRTMPANGKFSEEQSAIYNLVLKAQLAAIAESKAGKAFNHTFTISSEIVANGLMELGIITNKEEFRTYYMHGATHHLGLDVHDYGNTEILEPGNVITVEPGIYIPENSNCDPKWWNIGVRIEDVVLITKGEPEVLSGCSPKTIEEIEEFMLQESRFKPFLGK